MGEDFKRCIHCGQRIERINFALGQKWMHYPTPYGNYRTRELYEVCHSSTVATPPVVPEHEVMGG